MIRISLSFLVLYQIDTGRGLIRPSEAGRWGRMTLLRDLWQSRVLLWSLVKRDLKVRYRNSVLGFFWSFCRPLFLMIIMSAVFSMILGPGYGEDRAELVPYPLFLLTGILPWMYFAHSMNDSITVMMTNSSLIKKVAVNSAVFPASVVLGNLVHLMLAFAAYGVFLVYYGVYPGWSILLLIPAIVIQTTLIMAVALFCSVVNVFYRDIASLAEVFLSGWFYVAPILYPVDMAARQIAAIYPEWSDSLMSLYLLNPMTPIMMAYRRALIFTGDAPLLEVYDKQLLIWLMITGAISLILYLLAWRLFRRMSGYMVDEL